MNLTKTRRNALAVLARGPVPEPALQVHGFRRGVMEALVGAGLARWHPYGKPPNWKITRQGREHLTLLKAVGVSS